MQIKQKMIYLHQDKYDFDEVIDMKNKNFMYGVLCAAGGAMIGFSANQLGAPIGTIGFAVGVALLTFSAAKLKN